ncbi:MAG: hypothetical protein EOP86_01105 [Verrucomicrobiaceae bacterium]|nr:MAG: hypothetical protein EOP86_01105 [Verrucomicrobiaceae bacterium]
MKLPPHFIACLLLGAAAPAQALLIDFDNGDTTTATGAPLSAVFSLDYAYLETEDAFGDPLPVPSWRPYDSDPAVVADSAALGYGPPVSGQFALDALNTVLISFSAPISIADFSTVLDNSTFGSPGSSPIEFFGADDQLLASIPVDQSTAGFLAALGSPVGNVSKIVLPGGALYDNLTIVEVPEPGVTGLLAATGLLALRRRGSRSPGV